MNENTAIFLVEVFYRLSLRVKFHSARDRRREFLVGEIDACELGIEGTGDEGAEEGVIAGVFVEGREGWGGGGWDERQFT